MKKYNDSLVHTYMQDALSADALLRNPVLEQDIITLQNMMLTNGVHYIVSSDAVMLRPVIIRFLEAMHHFQTLSFLSFDEPIEDAMSSLSFEQLYFEVASRVADPDFIFDFILHELVCDFLWIEHHPVFNQFLTILLELKVDQNIPILLVG